MSERQYIGARYVPVFANPIEWNINTAYEALTIVTYQGSSYTSKKNVPAGTAISDTTFWAMTGNYNAQVETYREEVEQLAEDYYKTVNDKYIIIADSYGVTTEERTTTWVSYLVNYLGLNSAKPTDTITEQTNCVEFCHGGSGFLGLSGSTPWLTYLINNYPQAYDKEKVTKIIIGGGLNDYSYTTTQIANAINAFAAYVSENFPNAKVYLAFFGSKLDANVSLWNAYTTYKEVSRFKNWVYCTGAELLIHNTYNMNTVIGTDTPDYSHPNDRGSVLLARTIKNILDGYGAPPIEASDFLTPHTGEDYDVTASRTVVMRSGIRGVETFIYPLYSITFTFSTQQTITNDGIVIGTINNSYFRNSASNRYSTFLAEVESALEEIVTIKHEQIGLNIDKDGVVRVKTLKTGAETSCKYLRLYAYTNIIQNALVD